jgi:hypothetical protein
MTTDRSLRSSVGITQPRPAADILIQNWAAALQRIRPGAVSIGVRPSSRSEGAVPVGGGHSAIHEEVATGDEPAVRAHEQRTDSSHLVWSARTVTRTAAPRLPAVRPANAVMLFKTGPRLRSVSRIVAPRVAVASPVAKP